MRVLCMPQPQKQARQGPRHAGGVSGKPPAAGDPAARVGSFPAAAHGRGAGHGHGRAAVLHAGEGACCFTGCPEG